MGRICRKEGFKSGMKERVGDEKLMIISETFRGINDHLTGNFTGNRHLVILVILQLNALHSCHQHL